MCVGVFESILFYDKGFFIDIGIDRLLIGLMCEKMYRLRKW